MTTVYDGAAVVNPEPRHLGTGVLDLYDWLRSRNRTGRTRRVEELAPPGAPRYEQLGDILRRRIFDGTWPDDASGPTLGREYNVSQPVVQRAFEDLERKGLVRMESGRRTTVAPRRRWHVEFTAPLPADASDKAVSQVTAAFEAAQAHPGVTEPRIERWGDAMRVWMIAESATPLGAIALASPFGEQVLGGLPMDSASARPA